MTNNTSSSYGAAQGIMAKTALNELRASGHPLGRPLALCLMFESIENQLMAASLFDLAIALDAALHIPSDSLLAAIRIQWWADAVTSTANQKVPLVTCLQSQYCMRDDLLPQLQELISEWQAACHDENRDSSAGWAAAWQLVAIHLGQSTAADQAAIIGRGLNYAAREQGYDRPAGNVDIDYLRQNGRSWLYLSACFYHTLQREKKLNLKPAQIKHQMKLDDPGLVWRILSWHIFGPPR